MAVAWLHECFVSEPVRQFRKKAEAGKIIWGSGIIAL